MQYVVIIATGVVGVKGLTLLPSSDVDVAVE